MLNCLPFDVSKDSQFLMLRRRVCQDVPKFPLYMRVRITVSKSQWKGTNEHFCHAGVLRGVSYPGGGVFIMGEGKPIRMGRFLSGPNFCFYIYICSDRFPHRSSKPAVV